MALISIFSLDVYKRQPLGRTGTPREAGEAIAYLLEAEFLTGQVLGLNGGMVV